ncbi:MAG: hypothetical protein JWO95_3660, partial [Verrucomicrobiales bacterium]|nr:hypothetical protein [Verrucomicrobiales bacterium]
MQTPRRMLCIVALLSFLGCSRSQPLAQPPRAVDSGAPIGKLFEVHVYSNCPSIRIYMKGWQDSFFDAFIDVPQGEKLLSRDLPELRSYFRGHTNSIEMAHHAKYVGAKVGEKMYDVYWSADLKRVGIAFVGNWVAAYDLSTGTIIKLDSMTAQTPNDFQSVAQKFMENGSTH